MGGFDSLYHHELAERLAWRPAQARELPNSLEVELE